MPLTQSTQITQIVGQPSLCNIDHLLLVVALGILDLVLDYDYCVIHLLQVPSECQDLHWVIAVVHLPLSQCPVNTMFYYRA